MQKNFINEDQKEIQLASHVEVTTCVTYVHHVTSLSEELDYF